MARRKNRSRSKISQLPPEIRSTVDAMAQAPAQFTINDSRAYLAHKDVAISESAIGTYARELRANLESRMVAQETMRVMAETAAKVPEVDAVEIINRIAGQKMLQAVINKPEEEWTKVELDKLLREMNAMTKAVAYKQRIDQQNKTDVQVAADELKAQFFSALGAEYPDLYRQVVQILERKAREAEA